MTTPMTNQGTDYFSQLDYQYRLDWGVRGAAAAAARGDAVVVVDVLRFSTTAIYIHELGGIVCPASNEEELAAILAKHDAIVVDNPLAIGSYKDLKRGTRFAIRSPNGAACVCAARRAPRVLVGAIVNAPAVSKVLQGDSPVTVIACGEQWPDAEGGGLRFALEDYLGAGAIFCGLDASRLSPEARVCVHAFRGSSSVLGGGIRKLIESCGSGRELLARGDDITPALASRELSDNVPILQEDGRLA